MVRIEPRFPVRLGTCRSDARQCTAPEQVEAGEVLFVGEDVEITFDLVWPPPDATLARGLETARLTLQAVRTAPQLGNGVVARLFACSAFGNIRATHILTRARTTIGRGACDVALGHDSVPRAPILLSATEAGSWRLRQSGATEALFVNGVLCDGTSAFFPPAHLRVGVQDLLLVVELAPPAMTGLPLDPFGLSLLGALADCGSVPSAVAAWIQHRHLTAGLSISGELNERGLLAPAAWVPLYQAAALGFSVRSNRRGWLAVVRDLLAQLPRSSPPSGLRFAEL